MTTKRHFTIFAVIGLAVLSFSFARPTLAVSLVPECAKEVKTEMIDGKPVTKAPSLNCALQTFGNIANLILGITGSLALLMFVYGGFKMITAAGESGKVDEGKTVLKNAVIGIIVIMTAGIVINYGLGKLKVSPQNIIGQQCPGGGVSVLKPDGSIGCVTSCNSLGNDYECIDPSRGINCVVGICPGGTDSVCCQPKAAAVTTCPDGSDPVCDPGSGACTCL